MTNLKNRIGLLSGLALASLAWTAPADATNFSFTGNLSSGNDVQVFSFAVGAPSTVTMRTWSYAGGTNAVGMVIARGGFDPILALFNPSGQLINQNDDGGVQVAADSVTGEHFDTFLSTLLNPGTYKVSVMAFPNFAVGPNLSNGFQGSGSLVDVTGNQRDTHWAFDILNVGAAVPLSTVPEPATWAMMVIGFGLLGAGIRRRTRIATKATSGIAYA